jgi:ATP-binding cassette subfamily B multidrug efflux pump
VAHQVALHWLQAEESDAAARRLGFYAGALEAELARVEALPALIALDPRLGAALQPQAPAAAVAEALPALLAMAALVLVGRPLALMLDSLVRNNAVVPGVTSMIRWQSHWHVVRQSWPFFQNDFAGRIANRVMQTGNSVRDSVVSSIRAVWYIAVYGVSALVLMGLADWRLALPTLLWFVGYAFFLRHFVPQMRDLAKASSEVRSGVVARVVDTYTNILTVKLFARPQDEDRYVQDVIEAHKVDGGWVAQHPQFVVAWHEHLARRPVLALAPDAPVNLGLHGRAQAPECLVAGLDILLVPGALELLGAGLVVRV